MQTVQEVASTVLAVDNQTALQASAIAPASATGQCYYITGVDASYSSGSQSGLLQLKDGNTVIWQQYVNGYGNFNFPSSIRGKANAAFSAVLAAGAAGIVGTVNLRGYLM